jgi:hypothetical protein
MDVEDLRSIAVVQYYEAAYCMETEEGVQKGQPESDCDKNDYTGLIWRRVKRYTLAHLVEDVPSAKEWKFCCRMGTKANKTEYSARLEYVHNEQGQYCWMLRCDTHPRLQNKYGECAGNELYTPTCFAKHHGRTF